MARSHYYNLPDLVIPNGDTASNAIPADPHYRLAKGFTIQAPDTLTATATVAVSLDGGSTYSQLQSGGSDIDIGTDETVAIDFAGWTHMRIEASGAEGAERTFKALAIEEF